MENSELTKENIDKFVETMNEQIGLAFEKAYQRLRECAEGMRKEYEERGDEINAEAEVSFKKHKEEQKRLMSSMPKIRVGDIVRIKSCHTTELKCYEVDSIQTDGVVSQPAGFHHDFNEIIAIYRFYGKDFKCIWEREDYKQSK